MTAEKYSDFIGKSFQMETFKRKMPIKTRQNACRKIFVLTKKSVARYTANMIPYGALRGTATPINKRETNKKTRSNMMNSKKTFREILTNNEPNEVGPVTLKDGNTIKAICWTDDDELLDEPAIFDLETSWGGMNGIGPFDNLHGELDVDIWTICSMISDKVGGEWRYDSSDALFVQED